MQGNEYEERGTPTQLVSSPLYEADDPYAVEEPDAMMTGSDIEAAAQPILELLAEKGDELAEEYLSRHDY